MIKLGQNDLVNNTNQVKMTRNLGQNDPDNQVKMTRYNKEKKIKRDNEEEEEKSPQQRGATGSEILDAIKNRVNGEKEVGGASENEIFEELKRVMNANKQSIYFQEAAQICQSKGLKPQEEFKYWALQVIPELSFPISTKQASKLKSRFVQSLRKRESKTTVIPSSR